MTREEAWRRAKGYLYDALSGEEADEIIEALEQEPREDAISRQSVLEIVEREQNKGDALSEIEKLPPVKQEFCEDCISRQAVLEIFEYVMDYWKEHAIDVEPHEIKDALIEQYEFTAKQLSELPPVKPQEPKKGHWIMTNDYLTTAYGSVDYVKCSCCGEDSLEEGNYCPNCGAEMESEVEE